MTTTSEGAVPADPSSVTGQAEPRVARDESQDRHNHARWLALLAGVLAGLASFGLGEAVYELIPAEKGRFNTMGTIVVGPSTEAVQVAEARNGALAFGLLGVCLAGILGIAGGAARRSTSHTVVAGLLGSILGLALGGGSSLGVLPLALTLLPRHPESELIISMLMHVSIWGLCGAAAGLAFGVGLGGSRQIGRFVMAGFVGAVLGSVIFEVIGATIFPLASTGHPISTTWLSRLVARFCVTLATAGAVAMSLSGPRNDRTAPETMSTIQRTDA